MVGEADSVDLAPVKQFYRENAEKEQLRLQTPSQQSEYLSTIRLIEKYFPKSGSICDIGCGPGRYSLELLNRGYSVTLFDLSEELLAIARAQIEQEGLQAKSYVRGDARDLSQLGTHSFDAVLVMGPLYHLFGAADRRQVLTEVKRVLKIDGIGLFAYLNSWGFLRTGIHDVPQLFEDRTYLTSLLGESGLDIWYMSTPQVATEELHQAGFDVVSYAGAESFTAGMRVLMNELATRSPKAHQEVVRLAAETSEMPQYRDAADHLHIVAKLR
jgi:2-polyprenyl-3-methyl-5-hydroxy-6-metoxy-1,4-benzoquinol methylase